jgi:hypothetical protein
MRLVDVRRRNGAPFARSTDLEALCAAAKS